MSVKDRENLWKNKQNAEALRSKILRGSGWNYGSCTIPDVDRARGSPRNVLAVISSVNDGLYKLCEYAIKMYTTE